MRRIRDHAARAIPVRAGVPPEADGEVYVQHLVRMKPRLSRAALACAMLALAACTSFDAAREETVINSIPFDATPCPALQARRDALAARHGLPVLAERAPMDESRFTGLGPLIADSRSQNQREIALANGTIDAMNRSLARRNCI